MQKFKDLMYNIASDFFWKKIINMYWKLEIRVVCREFLAFFKNKSYDYLYLYIRNLENSHLKPVFRYTISISICVGSRAGREYEMDIVLSKNGVKCAVFKISDVQMYI